MGKKGRAGILRREAPNWWMLPRSYPPTGRLVLRMAVVSVVSTAMVSRSCPDCCKMPLRLVFLSFALRAAYLGLRAANFVPSGEVWVLMAVRASLSRYCAIALISGAVGRSRFVNTERS